MNNYKIEKFDWDKKYLNCLWNDGLVASIKIKEGEYQLFVVGYVKCELIAKTNIITKNEKIPKGTVLAYTNGNGIGFYHEMSSYIKDDYDLNKIISGEHPLYLLEFQNNNWIELDYLNKDKEYEELDIVLDSCMINDALDEVIEMIQDLEEERKEYLQIEEGGIAN